MVAEPTSILTFNDLILEVARKIGVAYYGSDGDEVVQIPVDAHDLAECKRHVNNGIRMFLADAPEPHGWRFTRPTAQVTVWGNIGANTDNTVTAGAYDSTNDTTDITAEKDSFYESMEGKTINIDGTDYTIKRYQSATVVHLKGDQTGEGIAAKTWSIDADGQYTLPASFSGEYTGVITYTANTNQGVSLEWTSEAVVRQWRENITDETGDPYWAAVRIMTTVFDDRRRWELMLYPRPDEIMTVEFPYTLHFDKLTDTSEVPPVPYSHDDTVKAACLAVAETDVEGAPGPTASYYRTVALPNSYRIDNATAPRRLGYFGNPGPGSAAKAIRNFRDYIYQRPDVSFNE